MSYDSRFSGIARLYGADAAAKFRTAHVAVIGIGGVGSWTVEALARSGVGTITLVDLDEICITNVNRQLHARDGEIGRLKIEAMTERARQINPDIRIALEPRFYNEKSAADLLSSGFDCVVDAIDSGRHKAHLVAHCHQRQIPIIVCGAAGGKCDPTRIETNDLARVSGDGLLLKVRRELRSHFGFAKGIERPGHASRPSKKFGITAVFSQETPVYPQCDGSVSPRKPQLTSTDGQPVPMKLNCADGFGSSSPVTGTFGLIAAAEALKAISAQR